MAQPLHNPGEPSSRFWHRFSMRLSLPAALLVAGSLTLAFVLAPAPFFLVLPAVLGLNLVVLATAAWFVVRPMLREAESKLHLHLDPPIPIPSQPNEQTPCGFLSFDRQGRLLWINDRALVWLGLSRQEILGKAVVELLASGDQSAFLSLLSEANETFPDLEVDFRHKNGTRLSALVTVGTPPANSSEYEVPFRRVAFVDITERKRREREHEESRKLLARNFEEQRRRMRLVLDTAKIAVREWEIAENRMNWSDNFLQLLGLPATKGRLSLEDYLAQIEPTDREMVASTIKTTIQDANSGDSYEAEYRLSAEPGTGRAFEEKGRVVRDAHGQPIRVISTILDITERRRASEQLRQLRERAEKANESKSNYLAGVTHEIRNPLNGIIGLIELMGTTQMTEQQRGFLTNLSKSAETLLGLINDVLDMAKIEAGRLELERISFDLPCLVRDSFNILSAHAEQKGLRVDCQIEPSLPKSVVGDPGRLCQVLLNLLSNAIKFTDSPEVSGRPGVVELSVAAQGASRVRFSVRDTGVGIPEDRLQAIFQPFAQGDSSTTRTHGGTGLGLSISSLLVERFGGKLEVNSVLGQGSIFSFTAMLPESASEQEQKDPTREVSMSTTLSGTGKTVLVVEDNNVNQQVMTFLLEQVGYRVEIANNGIEALQRLEEKSFDIILMDVQMPEMDGIRATRLIRARERAVGGHVPIVAVTANALQGERQRCLGAGMDDYLAKPIRGPELYPLMAKLLGLSDPSETKTATATTSSEDRWQNSLLEMGFDQAGIERLVEKFLETVPARIINLRTAVSERDAPVIYTTTHSLKNSLTVFGIRAAVELANRLELQASQGKTDEADTLLQQLVAEVEPILTRMKVFANGNK
jgi:PAS domain S-box-containing protein